MEFVEKIQIPIAGDNKIANKMCATDKCGKVANGFR